MSREKMEIIAESPQMKKILQTIDYIKDVDSSVLITGESGTGKEVIFKYICQTSRRRDKPIVKINCGAIPENLFESELFGYEDGAFTGARKKGKAGLFEMADQGTLFLDEVGEMNPEMQVKLLRAIQEKEIFVSAAQKVFLWMYGSLRRQIRILSRWWKRAGFEGTCFIG